VEEDPDEHAVATKPANSAMSSRFIRSPPPRSGKAARDKPRRAAGRRASGVAARGSIPTGCGEQSLVTGRGATACAALDRGRSRQGCTECTAQSSLRWGHPAWQVD
jgi:hypothetical protein